jgi:hypothetical protein
VDRFRVQLQPTRIGRDVPSSVTRQIVEEVCSLRADIFLCDTACVHAVGAPALSSVFAALLLTRPMLDVEAFHPCKRFNSTVRA